MPFFDFHLHPSLKPQMSDPSAFPSPWEQVVLRFANPDIITALLKCSGINEVVDSQASLSQLTEAGMNLIAIALHPPESNMMRDALIKKIAAEEQTSFINLARVNAIASGDIYYQMLKEEMNNLQTHLQQSGKQLKIISNMNQYNADDLNTVHAVLNVEGPHAFYGQRTGRSTAQIIATFHANFEEFTAAHKIFALNIAHLQDNDFCNHAFGIQIFKPKPFFPVKNGITQEGIDLVQKMQAKNILVDIKHTSLFARQQLYGIGLHGQAWPLVCTHAGLTGIPSSERGRYFLSARSIPDGFLRVRHFKPIGYLEGTSFNACSINLYDDDVVELINNGGMIGLSMDQRILGTPDELMMSPDFLEDFYEEEVISPGEKEFFRGVPRPDVDDMKILKRENIRPEDRTNAPLFHARHFMNQLFHLFNIADKHGISKDLLATRICIGSDFDGMINPVDCCKNVTGLQAFKDLLLEHFTDWETEFVTNNGIRVSAVMPPGQLFDRIFYQNGVDYLRTRLV
jgi:microsomal dipeptidase-like Zn-dependent dipeptidase